MTRWTDAELRTVERWAEDGYSTPQTVLSLIEHIRYLNRRINDLHLGCEVDEDRHPHGGIL